METLDMKIERNDAAVEALEKAKIREKQVKKKTVRVRDYFKIGLLSGCDFSITVDKKATKEQIYEKLLMHKPDLSRFEKLK
jgi:hypothetical protein